MDEVRSELRIRLARELRKAVGLRDHDLEDRLRRIIENRGRHFAERVSRLVSNVQNLFRNNRFFKSPFKLLLYVIGREKSDARGALVQQAASAAADGTKRCKT